MQFQEATSTTGDSEDGIALTRLGEQTETLDLASKCIDCCWRKGVEVCYPGDLKMQF